MAIAPVSVALAITTASVFGLIFAITTVTGELVYPLDDAYIHLGVARNLAEHGAWGVNPGEFASASSSPLWTALLAAVFLLTGPSAWVALVANLLAAALLLGVAARWLRDEGVGDHSVRAGLVALVLAVPLPFLAALGMEHVLQVATVLLLVRAGERARGARNLALLALSAAVAALVRFEGAFVAGWLGLALLAERRVAAAVASAGGAALAIGGFGALSLWLGGLFLPNSVVMKAVADRDWWSGLVSALDASGAVLALAAAASLGAAALDTGALHRRRVTLFVLVAATHLALARVGWLFRYEAYLVAWGTLLLVSPARLLLARPDRRGLLLPAALALAVPLAVRSTEACYRYVVGARFHFDVDVSIARWVAIAWPDATIAAHNLGALSFFTDATLVDVAGIGTNEITTLHLKGGLNPDSASEVLSRRGVHFAVTGRTWMEGSPPTVFEEAASLVAPYPSGSGEFETVIWSVDPAARPRLLAGLAEARDGWSGRVRLVVSGEVALPLERATLTGAAVQHEGGGIAFYTNGSADLHLPVPGRLQLTLWGTEADGRPPRLRAWLGDREVEVQATVESRVVDLGPVEADEHLRLLYEDDLIDLEGRDRNLFVPRVVLSPRPEGVAEPGR